MILFTTRYCQSCYTILSLIQVTELDYRSSWSPGSFTQPRVSWEKENWDRGLFRNDENSNCFWQGHSNFWRNKKKKRGKKEVPPQLIIKPNWLSVQVTVIDLMLSPIDIQPRFQSLIFCQPLLRVRLNSNYWSVIKNYLEVTPEFYHFIIGDFY